MVYCAYTDVTAIIHTTLTQTQIEAIIAESDWEIDQTIGAQTAGNLGARKLSKLLSAIQVKTKQPTAMAAGEYRETHDPVPVWQMEVDKLFKLMKGAPGKIVATPYEWIEEDDRYQKDVRE